MSKGNRIYKPRTPIWFILSLIVVISYTVYNIYNQQLLLNSIDDDIAVANARLKEVKELNTALLKEKDDLQNPEYIEKLAREELGMTKEGELPYIYKKNR